MGGLVDAKIQELKSRLAEIDDLDAADRVLGWDQSTHMPPGGAEARGRQRATLGRLTHERLTDPALGRLLEDLRPHEERLPYESDEAALIRVARRDHERAMRVPASFVAEHRRLATASYQLWTAARPANDFEAVRPSLEKMLEMSRRYADFFPGYEHPADPLIAAAEEGWKTSEISAIFAELRGRLVPLVEAVTSRPPVDDACVHQTFPEAAQLGFGQEVVRRLGYDFHRGRQDKTHHPFMTKFSLGDVRITTRVKETFLPEALFSTIHEAGHALYEQGIRIEFEGTPLAGGTSPGFHESQSRLWENLVGRSRGFWVFFYPRLQAVFPDQLGRVPLEVFLGAVNRVERSLIRTDADEVTYNLHVMLRFDLELELLEGKLSVAELPEAWNARYRSDLGVASPDHRDGILQDVHWFAGGVGGAFQGYTLGNLLGAQLFEAALRAHPGIPAEIEVGEFGTLRTWLTEQVYRHGRTFTAPELVVRASGAPLSVEPFIRYLRAKYGER